MNRLLKFGWVATAMCTALMTGGQAAEDAHGGHEAAEAGRAHEWAGAFDLKPELYRWSCAKKGGRYADPAMKLVVLRAEGDDALAKAGAAAAPLFAGEGPVAGHGGAITEGAVTVLRFDTAREMTVFEFRPRAAGRYVFLTEHVPYEFEANEHFFKDASGRDIEPAAEETVGGHGHAHGEACAHDEQGEEADAIELPASAQKLLGMTFATAVRRPVAGTARFPGRFEWMPGAARVYGAALGGKVEVKVKPAQRVKAGDVLFTVRSPEWVRQRGEAREAEASLALARAEASAIRSRLAQLREAGTRHAELEMALAVKEAEVVRAERLRESAEERRQAVLGLCREQGGELVFAAVEEGVVESLGAVSGSWVEAGAEVVRTVRSEMVWFRADGLMVDLARVRDGMRGFVEPFQGGGLSADVRAEGRLELGLSAEAGRRVRPLYLRPERVADWMVQGRAGVLSAVVEESAADAVAVPLGSVVTDGLKSVVFVRDAANKNLFHRREVVPGVGDNDWVEVKGVNAGSEVVLNGAYELKLATPSAAGGNKAAGHFHADGKFHEGEH